MKKHCSKCMHGEMKKDGMMKKKAKKKEKARGKFDKVMHEYKEDMLHSGSKRGPKVKNPKQAIARFITMQTSTGMYSTYYLFIFTY